tara:strand:- start:128 stop:328 length:201 start_codon:yes stop_codon:yes gene_type:complete
MLRELIIQFERSGNLQIKRGGGEWKEERNGRRTEREEEWKEGKDKRKETGRGGEWKKEQDGRCMDA